MLTEAVGPVGYQPVDHTAADTHTMIAADPQGRKTRILGLVLSNCHASTPTLITIQDNAGTPNVIAGPFNIPGGGQPVVLPVNGLGWGESAAGKTIDIVSSANVRVAGSITYQRVGSRAPTS
jgi:hypothetical protein